MPRLSRRQFHALVAAGAGTCLLGGCAAGVQATLTPVDDMVVLTFAQFPALATAGGSAVVGLSDRFPIVVVRTADTSATALSATCTHAGCILGYEPGPNQIHCPCHNANFSLQGAVLGGPTSIPLPVYTATVESDGISVNLS
jgi:nitrite reductase/ring-hydroxylating ferredoxin subunit